MHHPVLWATQVSAVSSSQAREETAVTPPGSLSQGLELLPAPQPFLQHVSRCPSLPYSPRSFCSEHRPLQEAQEAPPEGTNCLMCLEPVGDTVSYHTMVCPACRHTWFHRGCIQVGALPSPCRHTWCSAAPGTAHTHTASSSSSVANGQECWSFVFPVPQLSGF